MALLAVGFVPGRAVGLEPWMVAALGGLVLAAMNRGFPWRAVPWSTGALVAALAVLAGAAAPALPVSRLVGGSGTGGLAHTAAGGALAANVVNNLPALLVILDRSALQRVSPTVWALLLGVNLGPLLLVTGSLSGILWMDTARREGLAVGPGRYAAVGLLIGLPSLAAALGVLLILGR